MLKRKFLLLLLCPVFLFPTTARADGGYIIGHRGSPERAPENTLSSFAAACEQGADAVECDVRMTSDGRLVPMHDESTGRVWSEDISVEGSSYEALSKLVPGHGFRAAFPHAVGEHIPTFEEFDGVISPDTGIFAELKTDTPEACDALLDEINRLGVSERTTFISFSRSRVEQAHARGIKCALLYSPESKKDLESIRLSPGIALDLPLSAIDANTVADLHGRGYKVYVWQVQTEEQRERALRIGADGITTDII